jgi:glutamyl-tRNA reductase
LREAGVGSLVFANRTPELAADLARELGDSAVALDAIAGCLRDVDLVVSATAAPFPVLSASTLAAARTGATEPLVIIDLAVPRDVEEGAGALAGITLIALDALRGDADALANVQTDATLAQVEAIVAEGLRAYQRERTVRLAVPGITALRRHVDRSERVERTKALVELAHLSEADRAIVERFGQRLVDKMFHHLVSRIRSLAEFDEVPPELTMRVLERLFADPDAPAPAGSPEDLGAFE